MKWCVFLKKEYSRGIHSSLRGGGGGLRCPLSNSIENDETVRSTAYVDNIDSHTFQAPPKQSSLAGLQAALGTSNLCSVCVIYMGEGEAEKTYHRH